jgi:hypothetical protein
MARKRNYRTEYQRRIQRGFARDLSRSQARGHPRLHERHVSPKLAKREINPDLEEARKKIQDGKSLTAAARQEHVAPERLRNYLGRMEVLEKRDGRWLVNDQRPRPVLIYSRGRAYTVTVPNYEASKLVGEYMAAVKEFLKTPDATLLEPYKGKSVVDVKGKRHVFETRPNVLYRLDEAATDSFEQVYKIIV